MDDDLPFEKIAISGPTLSSLIQRSISSPCDIEGLLFGHVTHITPSSLSDDSPSPSSSSLLLIPTITSILSFSHPLSFYDPLGRVHLSSLRSLPTPNPNPNPPTLLLGFFVARRDTPLRPSMREFSISLSLFSQTLTLDPNNDPLSPLISPSSPPSIFLLLSSSSLSIHTHEYRAFQLHRRSQSFHPRPLDIINIGPAFRGHYDAFSPNSPFPWLPLQMEVGALSGEDEKGQESLNRMRWVSKEQRRLDACTQGFDVGRLSKLMGSEAKNYTSDLEDLYGKMLAKLEGLARAVEKSSARVLELVSSIPSTVLVVLL